MKLVSFSLQNYRSIQKAEKITLGSLTVLVGPNNEGKSNILRGLVAGVEILSLAPVRSIRTSGGTVIERYLTGQKGRELYDWERDFPISLQDRNPKGQTVFDFEFELSSVEIEAFKQAVKSNLNGVLPIRLSLGSGGDAIFEVRKRGPGGATLTKKRAAIARFVAGHLNLRDIPSIRTASSAMELVNEMVGRELRELELTDEYRKAVDQISELQAPTLARLSTTVKKMLSTFLPDVKQVDIEVSDRYSALRRNSRIVVDDGTATDLRYKGDGVQSLAAISLIHHVSQESAGESELVLAIEEPEAHLHPRAIHQLRSVLQDIASRQQVVLTTHSPLLINRSEISSNVIVDRNRARRARSIQEIRDALGVRVSDSLAAAELVLVVEGESDRRALAALLVATSTPVATAVRENQLAIDSLHGATNLVYKMSQLRDQLCTTHVFLDYDPPALDAAKKAIREGLLTAGDHTFATSPGMKESEIEDLYNFDLYCPMIKRRYNVDLPASLAFRNRRKKWTNRVEAAFLSAGQVWDSVTSAQVKTQVAELVEAEPENALHPAWRSSFDGLVAAIQEKLANI